MRLYKYICLLIFVINSVVIKQCNAQNDTVKINEYIQQVAVLKRTNIDSALIILHKIKRMSDENNFKKGNIEYLNLSIELSCLKGEFSTADSLLVCYKKMVNESKDELLEAYYHFNVGNRFTIGDNTKEALFHFEKAYTYFSKTNNEKLLMKITLSMSNLYNKQGLHSKAVEYANKILTIALSAKDTFAILSAYNNLNSSYYALKDTIKQLVCLNKLLSISSKYNNDFIRSVTCINYASFLTDHNKLDSVDYFLNLAIPFFHANGMNNYEATCYVDKARAQQKLHHLPLAEKYIIEAQRIFSISGEQIPAEELIYMQDIFHDVYKAKGNYKLALDALEKSYMYSDSLKTEESIISGNATDEKIKAMDYENKKLKSDAKITKQRNTIIGLVGLCTLLGLLGLFYYNNQRKKQLVKTERIKVLEKEKDLIQLEENMKGQLNERTRISKEIHDELGASLTSISLFTEILKKKIDTLANPEVNKISSTSSEMVDKMNEIIWSLNTHNDTLKSLIGYSIKFANTFLADANIKLTVTETCTAEEKFIDSKARRNIYLTIKEAINNIVKHAHATEVKITIDCNDGLCITIADNGKGFVKSNIPKFRNGLENMQKRIEEINGNFVLVATTGTTIKIKYVC